MTTTPRIAFYGGIGTIGGTKIVVEEGGFRILFDFGLTYAPGGDYWSGKLQPRSGAARLRDLLALGYAPALDGIYRATDLGGLAVAPGDGKTHVFISHLHLDHMGLVDMLDESVPVWMHEDSLRLFRAVAETGEQPPVPVNARGFGWGQKIAVGPITVTPLSVDHDVPGACGLMIETSAGTVVYTGDLRWHGAHPEQVDAFVEAARATRPKILLIEGTRLGEPEPTPERPAWPGEPAVAGKVAEIAGAAEGLALITLYPRNTERIGQIAEAVAAVGRTLVLSPEAAHVYATMGGDLGGVAVYRRHRDAEALAAGRAAPWLAGLLGAGVRVVDAATVRAAQQRYLLQLLPEDLPELVDLEPAPGSVFIHSNGEPLGKFDPLFELFARWLDRFGIALSFAGSSGHASSADLLRVVKGVGAEVLMPIHSHRPTLLESPGQRRVLPELGGVYEVATGERIFS